MCDLLLYLRNPIANLTSREVTDPPVSASIVDPKKSSIRWSHMILSVLIRLNDV